MRVLRWQARAAAGQLDEALASLTEALRVVSALLAAYMPTSTAKLLDALGAPDVSIAGAAFAADGTSVNNVLGYPGIFRGALLAGASAINIDMKRAAAWALAGLTVESELVPDVLDRNVHETVAQAVRQAALDSGVADPARIIPEL